MSEDFLREMLAAKQAKNAGYVERLTGLGKPAIEVSGDEDAGDILARAVHDTEFVVETVVTEPATAAEPQLDGKKPVDPMSLQAGAAPKDWTDPDTTGDFIRDMWLEARDGSI